MVVKVVPVGEGAVDSVVLCKVDGVEKDGMQGLGDQGFFFVLFYVVRLDDVEEANPGLNQEGWLLSIRQFPDQGPLATLALQRRVVF